jgi:hypothetical protein
MHLHQAGRQAVLRGSNPTCTTVLFLLQARISLALACSLVAARSSLARDHQRLRRLWRQALWNLQPARGSVKAHVEQTLGAWCPRGKPMLSAASQLGQVPRTA